MIPVVVFVMCPTSYPFHLGGEAQPSQSPLLTAVDMDLGGLDGKWDDEVKE